MSDHEARSQELPEPVSHPPVAQVNPLFTIAWALSPAIIMTLGGFHGDGTLYGLGLFASPVVLYVCSAHLLLRRHPLGMSLLLAVPLCVLMCVVNIFLGSAGCAGVAAIVR